ncbi:MAG: TolC family protein [Calditrichaceae bacterium]|nr:TolC family protein [Calditrichaceae bacterium]MBN2708616.1 TolC family protein [Calditrichaceae bacterium]RQV95466.1 MAG: TolC family protein [Calditrichota bacterium]
MIWEKNIIFILVLMTLIGVTNIQGQNNKQVIFLSWKNVVDYSLKDNIGLKVKALDYEIQGKETWKSLSYFLPSLSYQGIAQKNLELQVFVFNIYDPFTGKEKETRARMGSPYNFQHSLNLSFPVFTGGSRWFNYDIQKNIKKSLFEELSAREEETVLNTMQAYYGIILSGELAASAEEAARVAKQNLDQVQKFYNSGIATELDYQRAKAQYSSTLPVLESALSNKRLSVQRLKSLLDIPLTDSLVVTDSLVKKDFLDAYADVPLERFKQLSKEYRNDIKALQFQQNAAKSGEKLALGQFTPTLAVTAGLDYAAQMENTNIAWADYIRSKSVTLSLSLPLFEGGRRVLDYQIAKKKTNQMDLYIKQAESGLELDVEQSYYNFVEAAKSLQNLKDTQDQYKESLRISNLLYSQGMSNQLDVLNAQLLYTQSKIGYLQGVYNYNISQLVLLKSVGLLDIIWK